VPESILTNPATEGAAMPVSASGLSIYEVETRRIWSVQANQANSLGTFITTVFNANPQPGRMLLCDRLRLLQLWPHKAYLLSDLPKLTSTIATFETMLTDISFGFCELSLSGDLVFDFVKPYVSVDLSSTNLRESRNLRCRFGQYSILLWWDDPAELRILVDRSYAQSFRSYLEHLMQRHDWNSL